MRNRLGLVAAGMFVLGPVLATSGVVPSLAGFAIFTLGGILALGVAIASVVQAVRGRGLGAGGAAALAVALVFVGAAARGAGAPRINDFTTDLADPPVFKNALTLPANQGRDMSYPADYAEIQRACCTDLKPAVLPAGKDALAHARSVAEQMPSWEVTVVDAQGKTIEAVSTSRLFRFQDDVVIRIRPQPDGSSRVDMRSKSRDGKGDMGVNAQRIRDYIVAVSR